MSTSADAVAPAEAVATAVTSCPGVVRMAIGSPVEFATYLPGRRVHGVRIEDGAVEVHIVARPDTVLPDLADAVRRAVAAVVPAAVIDVFVDDLETEGEPVGAGQEGPPGQAVTG